jgi:hypothetical protein
MREFLNTPFPCGYRPRDYVRNVVIFVRCDDPADQNKRHMWDVEDYDNEWEDQEPPFLEDSLYSGIRHNIDFIKKLKFAKKPAITLVLLTSFIPRDRKFYTSPDIPRIQLNFIEVVLPTYRHFRRNGSKVNVVNMGFKEENWQDGWDYQNRVNVTWQAELMDEVYAKVCDPVR